MKALTFIVFFSACSASNILLMFPMSPKSHVNSFVPLFNKLSENGHNITMVTTFVPEVELPNCTFIVVKDVMHDYVRESSVQEVLQIFRELKPFSTWRIIWDMHLQTIEMLLEGNELKELIEGNYSFDLMISETLYLLEMFVAFGHIFNVPVISIDAHAPSAWSSYLTGNVHPYSYVPNFRLPFTDQMSFKERFQNTLLNLEEMMGSYYYYLPEQEKLMRKYLNHEKYNFPPLWDMLRNVSLTLVDSHFSLGYVRPYLPNTIEVGGLTLDEGDEMTQELEEYLDNSENGFIYFSFGSIINTASLPPEMIEVLLSAIGQLEQNVVMKWESDEFPNKPKNVWSLPWLPQNKILGHPNCRLFLSHGGVHGLTESIFHKVPLESVSSVIIPFFSDQYYNAKFAHKDGFAVILNNLNLTTESLLHAIYTVMENPEYWKNVERRSLILMDKDQNPVDKAAYWVEYVLRHNGAKHLRPACLDLNLFQYFLLDVISLSLLIIVVCLVLLIYIIKKLTQLLKLIYNYIRAKINEWRSGDSEDEDLARVVTPKKNK